MSAPCIFTPFIKRGGEVPGERQRKKQRGKLESDGEKRRLTEWGSDEEKERKRGERGRWKGTISMC